MKNLCDYLKTGVLAAALFCSGCSKVSAADDCGNNFYFSGSAGLSWVSDTEVTLSGIPTTYGFAMTNDDNVLDIGLGGDATLDAAGTWGTLSSPPSEIELSNLRTTASLYQTPNGNSNKIKYKRGMFFSAAAGYSLGSNSSVELELFSVSNKPEDDDRSKIYERFRLTLGTLDITVDGTGNDSSATEVDDMTGELNPEETGRYYVSNSDGSTFRSVFGNVYSAFPLGTSSLSAFVGAGAGYGKFKAVSDSNKSFAFQLKAGVKFNTTDDINFYMGLRKLYFMNTTIKSVGFSRASSVNTGNNEDFVLADGTTDEIDVDEDGFRYTTDRNVEVGSMRFKKFSPLIIETGITYGF